MCREICNNHVSGYFTLLPRFYNLAIRFLQPSVYAQISLMNCCQKGDLGDGNVANCETHIPLVYLCFIKNGKVLFYCKSTWKTITVLVSLASGWESPPSVLGPREAHPFSQQCTDTNRSYLKLTFSNGNFSYQWGSRFLLAICFRVQRGHDERA